MALLSAQVVTASEVEGGSSSDLRVAEMTTEHLVNPLGIDEPQPRLAWQLRSPERMVSQTAYQVLVASSSDKLAADIGDVWDPGKVSASQPAEVLYGGRPLTSRTRYFWKVRVWDQDENVSEWSQPAWFETAFLDPSEWTATWIGKDSGSATTPEPLLRREFTVPATKEVASARIYGAGIGYHQFFINGERIGDHELDPGFTDYDRRVLYVTHDVTEEVSAGTNAIGVSLGRGWYGAAGPFGDGCARWCGQPKLALELHIEFTDGTSTELVTDGTWRVANGPTISDSVASESYDARLEQPGWTLPGFDSSTWSDALVVTAPAGELRAQQNEPIKVMGELEPIAVSQPEAGVEVYDVGVITAGWARIVFDGDAGTTVSIRYSERLNDDGTVESQGGQTDTYILKGGGPETYEPSYSYKGYQYVEVSGDPLPEILSVAGLEVHSSVSSKGGFDSSSDLLDRYHQAMRRTILNNLHSVPTDTPVHEKLAYGGDAHLYGESAIRNFGMAAFFNKWMQDFADAQRPDGMIPVVVPDGHSREEDDPLWGGAGVLIHTYLHANYGDVSALRRGYPMMKRWMDYYGTQLRDSGYIYDGDTYGDWTGCVVSCSLPPVEQGPPNLSSRGVGGGSAFPHLIGTAFLYETSRQLAEIARTIGAAADAQELDELAHNISDAFHSRFYDPVTQTYSDVPGYYWQTSNLLALSFDLAPADVRDDVAANLVEDVSSRGDHLNTGATGTKLILPVLTDAGHGDLAYRVATNPDYPGWGHLFLACGATTMWESWTDCSSDLRRGGNPLTGSTAPRSQNHAFFGTVDDWLFTHVAGIQPTEPGFREIEIKPHPVGDLTWASAHQTTPLGRVSSSWTTSEEAFTLDVEVPVGATARVFFPATAAADVRESGVPAAEAPGVTFVEMDDDFAVFDVGSGTYEFLLETLAFDPAELDFGDVDRDATSAPQTATLRNGGDSDLGGLTFARSGSDSFDTDSDCGDSLTAGASCEVAVTFTPRESGLAEATLTVTSSQGATASLDLSGRGVSGGEEGTLTADIEGPSRVRAGEQAAFDGSRSTGDIVNWRWDMGDGTTIEGDDVDRVTHDYARPGRRTVTLIVEGSDGETATATHALTVQGPPAGGDRARPGRSGQASELHSAAARVAPPSKPVAAWLALVLVVLTASTATRRLLNGR